MHKSWEFANSQLTKPLENIAYFYTKYKIYSKIFKHGKSISTFTTY